MYVCDLVVHRLRRDGWTVWHQRVAHKSPDARYIVYLYRPGLIRQATAPTLTAAFREADRVASEIGQPGEMDPGPRFDSPWQPALSG